MPKDVCYIDSFNFQKNECFQLEHKDDNAEIKLEKSLVQLRSKFLILDLVQYFIVHKLLSYKISLTANVYLVPCKLKEKVNLDILK